MLNDRVLLEMINSAMEALPLHGKPKELYEPMEYILSLGGKRIRPVMLLMACDIYSGDVNRALPAALGVELFHNFSLIHDDIMDNAPIRRGKLTIHEKWNPNTAILSGDTMLVKAYEQFLKLPGPIIPAAIGMFSKTAVEVCEGQQYDMNFEDMPAVPIMDYMEMIRLKTAVLIAASLYLGGLTANAPEEDLANLYDFGIHTGLAFQLMDDLLDTYGDEKTFGKKLYGDIVARKKTYLYIKTYELSDQETRQRLERLYKSNHHDREDKIAETLTIFDQAGIRQLTIEKIREEHEMANDAFDRLNISPDRKKNLAGYAKVLAGRTF